MSLDVTLWESMRVRSLLSVSGSRLWRSALVFRSVLRKLTENVRVEAMCRGIV